MFISSAFFQKYEQFVDKSAKVLMAETVAPTSDRMFVEIRYKSLYMETYMVKQIISQPIKLFSLAEIFICKQRNNKILTWYGRRNDTFFANRPLTGCYNYVYPVFIPCNRCFDWSGCIKVHHTPQLFHSLKVILPTVTGTVEGLFFFFFFFFFCFFFHTLTLAS